MHREIQPAIHYWGTPVVLVSTMNENGTPNLAPMSSAWWLGWSCMLGLDASSKTVENLKNSRECVLNLPAATMAEAVDRLALTTGSRSVPLHKKSLGYRHVEDKFERAGLTPVASGQVAPPRVGECPVQLEAVVERMHGFAGNDARMAVPAYAVEVRIVQVHVDEDLLVPGTRDKIDPDRWNPLLMSFRQFYGRGPRAHESRLARGPEDAYAPWKSGGLTALAGRAVSAWSRYRYGDRRQPGPALQALSAKQSPE